MYILLVLKFSSIVILATTAIGSFGIGLLYKRILVAKQQKRILHLEDEMLSNHAHILALEKKVTEMRKEKDTQADYNLSQHNKPSTDHGLRVS